MILNVLIIICFVYVCWCIGSRIRNALKLGKKYYSLDFPIGLSICAILINVAYFTMGIPVSIIRWGILIIGMLISIFHVRKVTRVEVITFLSTLAIAFIMTIPGIAQGDQYYVWRGNYWDQFNYISTSIALDAHSIGVYENSGTNIDNDVVAYGSTVALNDRAVVALIFACLMTKGKGELFWLVYLYHCVLLASLAVVLFELATLFLKKNSNRKKCIGIILAGTYLFGFWGQLLYDLNAWSQISTSAIFAGIILLTVEFVNNVMLNNEYYDSRKRVGKEEVLLYILFCGGTCIYLENAIIHYFILIGTYIITMLLIRRKALLHGFLMEICILPVALGVNILANHRLLNFLVKQVTTSMDVVNVRNWWIYFDSYWGGFWNWGGIEDVKNIVCLIPSFFGLSFIMPNLTLMKIITIPWIICTIILSLLLFVLFFYVTVCKILHNNYEKETVLAMIVLSGMFGVMLLLLIQKPWEAGKLMTYISPYFYVALTLPLFVHREKRNIIIAIIKGTAFIIIITNLCFAVYGMHDRICNDIGNGFCKAYPSDQVPTIKEENLFDINMGDYSDSKCLELREENNFCLYYLKLKTLYANKEYYVKENYGYWSPEKIVLGDEKEEKVDAILLLPKRKSQKSTIEKKYIIGQVVDCTDPMKEKEYFTSGFNLDEVDRTWLIGKEAYIDLEVKDIKDRNVLINMEFSDLLNETQRVMLSVNDNMIYEGVITNDNLSISIPFYLDSNIVRIKLETPDAISPALLDNNSKDERMLSVCMRTFSLKYN